MRCKRNKTGIESDVAMGTTLPKVLRKGLRLGRALQEKEQQCKGKEAGEACHVHEGERMIGLLKSHGLGVWGSSGR